MSTWIVLELQARVYIVVGLFHSIHGPQHLDAEHTEPGHFSGQICVCGLAKTNTTVIREAVAAQVCLGRSVACCNLLPPCLSHLLPPV